MDSKERPCEEYLDHFGRSVIQKLKEKLRSDNNDRN